MAKILLILFEFKRWPQAYHTGTSLKKENGGWSSAVFLELNINKSMAWRNVNYVNILMIYLNVWFDILGIVTVQFDFNIIVLQRNMFNYIYHIFSRVHLVELWFETISWIFNR